MNDKSRDKKTLLDRLPVFSVILVFVILLIVGVANLPLLNIQYTPTKTEQVIGISYTWPGASARIIENEVTSKIEGVIASVRGVRDIMSTTYKNGGHINITLKKKANMDMVRFEISTLLRQIYPKLPEGVSRPAISASTTGETVSPIMSYRINANLTTKQIEAFAQNTILKELSQIKGVGEVVLSGATPFYVEIVFDPNQLVQYGLKISDVSSAIGSATREDIVGFSDMGDDEEHWLLY